MPGRPRRLRAASVEGNRRPRGEVGREKPSRSPGPQALEDRIDEVAREPCEDARSATASGTSGAIDGLLRLGQIGPVDAGQRVLAASGLVQNQGDPSRIRTESR